MRFLVLALLGLPLVTGCTPTWTVRHWDVTIEVETAAGLRTGRGVVETKPYARLSIGATNRPLGSGTAIASP